MIGLINDIVFPLALMLLVLLFIRLFFETNKMFRQFGEDEPAEELKQSGVKYEVSKKQNVTYIHGKK